MGAAARNLVLSAGLVAWGGAVGCRRAPERAIVAVSEPGDAEAAEVGPPAPPAPTAMVVRVRAARPGLRRGPRAPGEPVASACARLGPRAADVLCGTVGDPATEVHEIAVEPGVVLARDDVEKVEVWLDEGVHPLHAHVVTTLRKAAAQRLADLAKARPKGELVVVVDGSVEQVLPLVAPPSDRRVWITPPVLGDTNEPRARALAARWSPP